MRFAHTDHWRKKWRFRPDITDDAIEYAITHAPATRDKHWPDLLNAVWSIPPSGRRPKVVYKREGGKFKIVTAFWED
jgi:hypothetical protein